MQEILTSLHLAWDWLNPWYLIEVFVIFLVIYTFLRFMEGTRGEGILKGIFLIMLTFPILLAILAESFGILDRLLVIIRFFGAAAIPALVIVVQPELRRALMQLGRTRWFGLLFKGATKDFIDEVARATFRMSRRKIGALIAIEREVGLGSYLEQGTTVDGVVSAELLSTLFSPKSDLHDGAVVIQKGRVAAAGCIFPLSENPNIATVLGTRHRAALGVTEDTDAIVIVVSEETGTVSFVLAGHIEVCKTVEKLRKQLSSELSQPSAVAPPAESDVVGESLGAGGR